MGPSTAILSLTALTVAAGVGVLKAPSLSDPILSTAVTSRQTQKVSAHFQSAPAAEVMRWLNNNGYSFVVNDSDIAGVKTVTLNVTEQPVSAVANSIASALGGHWEETNGVHVFKKGSVARDWMTVPSGSGFLWGQGVPKVDKDSDSDWAGVMGSVIPDEDFQANVFGDNQLSATDRQKLEKQFGPDFQRKMKDMFGPEFQKKIQSQFGPEFQRKMQDQFGPEFQKKLQNQFGPEFEKQMKDQFGEKFQKQMQDQFGPEFQKKMEKLGAEMQKQMKDNPNMGKFSPDDFKFDMQMGDMKKMAPMNSFGGSRLDPSKFIKSLSSEQKARQGSQGYLRYEDLTRQQQAMFGGIQGSFDIQATINGQTMHVRRD